MLFRSNQQRSWRQPLRCQRLRLRMQNERDGVRTMPLLLLNALGIPVLGVQGVRKELPTPPVRQRWHQRRGRLHLNVSDRLACSMAQLVSAPSRCRGWTNPSRQPRWAARGRRCLWRTHPERFRAATTSARRLWTLWSSPSTPVRSAWDGVCTSRVFQARARRRRCARWYEHFARNPGTDRCHGSTTWRSTVFVCRHQIGRASCRKRV